MIGVIIVSDGKIESRQISDDQVITIFGSSFTKDGEYELGITERVDHEGYSYVVSERPRDGG